MDNETKKLTSEFTISIEENNLVIDYRELCDTLDVTYENEHEILGSIFPKKWNIEELISNDKSYDDIQKIVSEELDCQVVYMIRNLLSSQIMEEIKKYQSGKGIL